LGSQKLGKPGVVHLGSFGMDSAMTRRANIERLSKALDEAIACAEEADLTFVLVILEMARLEVDQTDNDNGVTMPSPRPSGKGR